MWELVEVAFELRGFATRILVGASPREVNIEVSLYIVVNALDKVFLERLLLS